MLLTQNEMVVLAGDMNWHVGISNVGYDGKHGGCGNGAGIGIQIRGCEEREPITGVWGQSFQQGPGAERLVRGRS